MFQWCRGKSSSEFNSSRANSNHESRAVAREDVLMAHVAAALAVVEEVVLHVVVAEEAAAAAAVVVVVVVEAEVVVVASNIQRLYFYMSWYS